MLQLRYLLQAYLLILLIGFSACEEAVERELQPANNGQLAVEAVLTDERRIQSIRLSTSYDNLNEEPPKVTDAEVWVEVNGIEVRFLQDSMNVGVYHSEVPFAVIKNLDFNLHIDWRDAHYTANSTLSEVAPIPEINFQRGDSTNQLTFDDSPFLYNPNQQAMYIMFLDWSHLSNELPNTAKIVFYTFSSIEESELSRPKAEELAFPRGTIVTLRKYGLNDDFADYLQALAIETQWNGGAFFSFPANLPSNISNNGLGFFSTCAVKEKVFIAL